MNPLLKKSGRDVLRKTEEPVSKNGQGYFFSFTFALLSLLHLVNGVNCCDMDTVQDIQ